MYLYAENWSLPFLLELLSKKLEGTEISHGGKIIKIFASHQDPRESMGKSSLVAWESDSNPFRADEVYEYKDREVYKGVDLERYLNSLGLTDLGKDISRALFRFANRSDTLFCQQTMEARLRDGQWAFNHPFDELDGIAEALQRPTERESGIHLDIFLPSSLQRLQKIVNFNRSENVLRWEEKKEIMRRGKSVDKERSFRIHPER